MTKKLSAIVLSFMLCVASLAANEVRLGVIVTTENISKTESSLLIPLVFDKLEENITKYTDFILLNSSNIKDILEAQRESEKERYSSSIESGKLLNETHEIFATIKKANEKYTLTLRLTSLSTGETKTFVSKAKSTVSDLYLSNANAVDELTIDICSFFNMPLSEKETNALLNGEFTLSISDKTLQIDKQIANYNKRIENAKKELEKAASLKGYEKDVFVGNVSSDIALCEVHIDSLKREKATLMKMDNALKEEEERDKYRNIALKEKINQKALLITNAITQRMQFDKANPSIMTKLSLIEEQKGLCTSVLDELNKQHKEIANNAISLLDKHKKEYFSKPYLRGELKKDGKTPTDFAIENRKKRYRESRNTFINDYVNDINELNQKLEKEKDELLTSIAQLSFSNSRIASSLTNELVVEFLSYDGEKWGWDLSVKILDGTKVIFETTSFLPFESVMSIDKSDYYFVEYQELFEICDSLIKRGIPPVVFTAHYDVYPLSVESPSCYKLKVSSLESQKINDKGEFSISDITTLTLAKDETIIKMDKAISLLPYKKYLRDFEANNIISSVDLYDNDRKLYPLGNRTNYPYRKGKTDKFIYFGDYPQSLKEEGVTVDLSRVKRIGSLYLYKGSDGYYYSRNKVDGKYQYYKYESVLWQRTFDTNTYEIGDGKLSTLYRSAYILDIMPFYIDNELVLQFNNYEISPIRAYLNSYDGREWGLKNYTNSGLLTNVFSPLATKLINDTEVQNDYRQSKNAGSGLYDMISALEGIKVQQPYYCADTIDKLFLLSNCEQSSIWCIPQDPRYIPSSKEDRINKITPFGWKGLEYTPYAFWLRSAGYNKDEAFCIGYDGSYNESTYVGQKLGVLPCFTINVDVIEE